MPRIVALIAAVCLLLAAAPLRAQEEGVFTIPDFKFEKGGELTDMKVGYIRRHAGIRLPERHDEGVSEAGGRAVGSGGHPEGRIVSYRCVDAPIKSEAIRAE